MSAQPKTAVLHRMVMPDHICPYGQKSLWLLRRKGYAVQDHHLKTRAETDAFKALHGVDTPPRPSSTASASAATTTCAATSAKGSPARTRPATRRCSWSSRSPP